MSGGNYWVDWSDTAFPQIRHAQDASHCHHILPNQSFTECKQEIIEHFQGDLDHARNRIKETRSLRLKDISPDEY